MFATVTEPACRGACAQQVERLVSLNKDPAWLEERKKRVLQRSQTVVVRSVGDRIHVLAASCFSQFSLIS